MLKANLTISDITIKNMYGTTSASQDPQAGTLVCSAPDVSAPSENVDAGRVLTLLSSAM